MLPEEAQLRRRVSHGGSVIRPNTVCASDSKDRCSDRTLGKTRAVIQLLFLKLVM